MMIVMAWITMVIKKQTLRQYYILKNMREYQPAAIRYHRPTYSNLEPSNPNISIKFGSFQSQSLERQVDNTKRNCSTTLFKCESSCLGESGILEREYQYLMGKVEEGLGEATGFSKHERIRIKEWMSKLSWRQNNPVWKKNVNFHLKVLVEMIRNGQLSKPFNNLPEEGPLRKLTIYDLPFPLREKFSNSKDRSKSKKSTENDNLSQIFNNSKQKLLNEISSLKGFDFSQSCILDSKKVQIGGQLIGKAKLKQKMTMEEQFREDEINMAMAMRPVFSNTKKRKDNMQKSNPNSSKMSNGKMQVKKLPMNKISKQLDKQNDPHSVNINRKLFSSRQKVEQQQFIKTQHFIKSDYSFSKDESSNPISWLNGPSSLESERSSSMDEEKRNLFPKMYKMLRENQEALSKQPEYSSLVEELQQWGRKMNLPGFQEKNLDDSVLSENSKAFLKASEEIKCKFEETDNETVQFMQFLAQIKSQDSSKTKRQVTPKPQLPQAKPKRQVNTQRQMMTKRMI